MSSAARYSINENITLVYFMLPDNQTHSKISLDGFLSRIYKKKVDPKYIQVKRLDVTVTSRVQHTCEDVGFFAKDKKWECENQVAYYRKESLYSLGLIPKNKYDYEWLIMVDNKTTIKGFDALYVFTVLSKLDGRFSPLVDQLRTIIITR